jgi:hypothetical protein
MFFAKRGMNACSFIFKEIDYSVSMLRAYRYRLEPDEKRVGFLSRQFGYCRFVDNWAFDLKTKAWQKEQEGLSIV